MPDRPRFDAEPTTEPLEEAARPELAIGRVAYVRAPDAPRRTVRRVAVPARRRPVAARLIAGGVIAGAALIALACWAAF